MEKKITLEQLAVFLPYKLQALIGNKVSKNIDTIIVKSACFENGNLYVSKNGTSYFSDAHYVVEPMLRPLSDYADIKISESLDSNEYTRAEIYKYAHGDMELRKLRYDAILTMARNHIDIFNWIPQGLAVNLNTIER